MNSNQRRALGGALIAFGVAFAVGLIIGPILTPSVKVPYAVLAVWGMVGGAAFVWVGIKVSE